MEKEAGSEGNDGAEQEMEAVKMRRVCLICGSHTNLLVDIFATRRGPNIIDVIYAKFKLHVDNDPKSRRFICYSCNNWLINWFSLENPAEMNELNVAGPSSGDDATREDMNRRRRKSNGPDCSSVVDTDTNVGTQSERLKLKRNDSINVRHIEMTMMMRCI